MNLRTMLLQAAERNPYAEALVEQERRLTYEAWTRQVTCLADSFAALGIRHGDRVAISMRNSIEFATSLYATQMLGAVAVPFNFRLKAETIDYVWRDSDAQLVIVDSAIPTPVLGEALGRNPQIRIAATPDAALEGAMSLVDLVESGSDRLHNDIGEDDLSMIVYTSGTTGRPKGVPLTQRENYGRLVTYIMTTGPYFDSGAKTLGAAPLYHTVGIHWVFLQTIFVNGTYYPVAKVDGQTWRFIDKEGITFIFGSPTLLRQVLNASSQKMESVRYVAYGSAPTEQNLLDEMFEKFPNSNISEVYGTTEVSIPFVTPSMKGRKPGTLRPTGDHRIRLVQAGFAADNVVGLGEVGELIVDMDNPGIFSGYWGEGAATKTAERVRDGWFYTGDLFRRDAGRNYNFLGRLDDMFVSGGENIQPVEVETVLGSHPGVADVAVIGTPVPDWGQQVTAFIVRSEPSLTEDVLDAFCKCSALENFKRPRKYVFLEEIPRNPSGKIVRSDLHELFSQIIRDSQTGD